MGVGSVGSECDPANACCAPVVEECAPPTPETSIGQPAREEVKRADSQDGKGVDPSSGDFPKPNSDNYRFFELPFSSEDYFTCVAFFRRTHHEGPVDICITGRDRPFADLVPTIEKILINVSQTLLEHFPVDPQRKIVVYQRPDGPVTHRRRGPLDEHIVGVDAPLSRWVQFIYQFSHELTHILASRLTEKSQGQWGWFEETLGEIGSLFVLRQFSRMWLDSATPDVQKSYGYAIKSYRREVIENLNSYSKTPLPVWFRKNKEALAKNSVQRELNGVVAVKLLPIFEAAPAHWAAITFLPHEEEVTGQEFEDYLTVWYKKAPPVHKPFVEQIARRFGIKISH